MNIECRQIDDTFRGGVCLVTLASAEVGVRKSFLHWASAQGSKYEIRMRVTPLIKTSVLRNNGDKRETKDKIWRAEAQRRGVFASPAPPSEALTPFECRRRILLFYVEIDVTIVLC